MEIPPKFAPLGAEMGTSLKPLKAAKFKTSASFPATKKINSITCIEFIKMLNNRKHSYKISDSERRVIQKEAEKVDELRSREKKKT